MHTDVRQRSRLVILETGSLCHGYRRIGSSPFDDDQQIGPRREHMQPQLVAIDDGEVLAPSPQIPYEAKARRGEERRWQQREGKHRAAQPLVQVDPLSYRVHVNPRHNGQTHKRTERENQQNRQNRQNEKIDRIDRLDRIWNQ
jgi:hypothetical protein